MSETLIYDPDKLNILDGFGITPERMNKLAEEYIHGSRGDVISRIVHDKTLPPNERYALLINVGVRLVESVVAEMQDAPVVSEVMTDKGA
jgi:hypothetical protein